MEQRGDSLCLLCDSRSSAGKKAGVIDLPPEGRKQEGWTAMQGSLQKLLTHRQPAGEPTSPR